MPHTPQWWQLWDPKVLFFWARVLSYLSGEYVIFANNLLDCNEIHHAPHTSMVAAVGSLGSVFCDGMLSYNLVSILFLPIIC